MTAPIDTAAMTPCQALLRTVPKDIADRQWVVQAVKILKAHEPMQAELSRIKAELKEISKEPIWLL